MKNLLFVCLLFCSSVFCQTQVPSYTKDFYEYDNNNEFKGIKFEKDFLSIKDTMNLVYINSNSFSIKNPNFLNWATQTFEWGNTQFIDGKLLWIQLGYDNNENRLSADSFYRQMLEYLRNLFGQPNYSKNHTQSKAWWEGKNLTISLILTTIKKDNYVNVLIYSNKLMELDNKRYHRKTI